MLTVDHYELIRRRHYLEGLSARAIAAELGHSRKTVAKALRHAVPPGYRRREPASCPVMGRFAAIVDAWLEQDRTRPVKQRHTAQRVYERLREEHGFTGASCTVRRYVAKVRTRGREVFMPLAFEPGEEAQVDWHEGWVVVGGEPRKLQFFCLRLCCSKASFVRAYERADLVSFLDGHVRALAYLGGVPRRLAYDNLKSAVVQVRHGRGRRLNARFLELRGWYVFDSRFCTPGRGNEKGDVENPAKRSERSYLTPPPEVASLAELNGHLLEQCRRDQALAGPRPHGARTRGQLLEEERRCLHALPESPFEACQQVSTRVDQRSLVTVDTNSYSAPVCWAHHPVTVKLYVEQVELWCAEHRVAVHGRSYEKGQFILEPTHCLNLLRTKPGSLDNARAFRGQPWGEDFALLRRELEYRYDGEGTKKFIAVLLLLTEHDEERVREAVRACVQRRAFSDEAVLAVLRHQPPVPLRRLDPAHRPELTMVGDGIRSAALYDRLRVVEQEVA